MAKIFSIDAEGVREIFGDLCDALGDVGFNLPSENFADPKSPLRRFISGLEMQNPEAAWQSLQEALQKLALDVREDVSVDVGTRNKAISYIKIAAEDLSKCCTFE